MTLDERLAIIRRAYELDPTPQNRELYGLCFEVKRVHDEIAILNEIFARPSS